MRRELGGGVGIRSQCWGWHLGTERAYRIQEARDDAVWRGPGWARRVTLGRAEMLRRYPGLARAFSDDA